MQRIRAARTSEGTAITGIITIVGNTFTYKSKSTRMEPSIAGSAST
ncbi:hypothetical protein SAEN111111_02920 [Saccharibacillus endophyticus]